jgi:hypothetical protein
LLVVPLIIHWAVAGFVGFFVGMLARNVFIKGTDEQQSTWGFVALGLLVGFLVGMSESPLISGALTGGFTLAGTVVGKLWDPSTSPKPPTIVVVGESEPRALMPIPAEGRSVNAGWLLALCGGAVVGVVLGVAVRANRVLVFREQTIDARLVEVGFSPKEAGEIHQRWVKTIGFSDVIKAPGFPSSGVQSAQGELAVETKDTPRPPTVEPAKPKFKWYEFWRDVEKMKSSPHEILEVLKGAVDVPLAVLELVEGARALGRSDGEVVQALRMLTEKRSTER